MWCILVVTSFVVLFLMCPGSNGAAPRVERHNHQNAAPLPECFGFLKRGGEIFEEESCRKGVILQTGGGVGRESKVGGVCQSAGSEREK